MTLKIEGSTLSLSHGSVEQSEVDLTRPGQLSFEYMQHLDLLLGSRSKPPAPVRAFHAGAGACALALAWENLRPGSTQVAVDTDQQMLSLLKAWKVVGSRSGIRLRAGDARGVLEGSQSSYDVIVRDAFAIDRTPARLVTIEWSNLVKSRLRQEGTYLANVAHGPSASGKGDVAGVLSTFENIVAVADRKVWRGVRRGNIALAAWNNGECDVEWLQTQVRRLPLPASVYGRSEIRTWLGGQRPQVDSDQ